ncbi:unnamed protein product [Clonostachys byssicola]|uniref:Transcription factor domain-containing protein n=1 Tax=Clonostachys byssicola TaxID=160290 RepID=A0A9N9U964_9HYPO|nr:unnamed protein product [Clonostachys byssicola]
MHAMHGERPRSSSTTQVHVLPSPNHSVGAETIGPQVRYPNPGYLGSSSHTTLFDHLRREHGEPVTPGSDEGGIQAASPYLNPSIDKNLVGVGAQLLNDLTCLPNLWSYFELVQGWVAKGANLGLAEPLTGLCVRNTRAVLSTVLDKPETAASISRRLFVQSSLPMSTDPTSTLEDFCSRFDEPRARWETIGLFFTAACRAATDSAFVVGVYDTEQDRQNMQGTAMRFSDRCLEVSLFLDRLGDFQLFLQYENFICHSQIDGDQSYRSWRKLGDVASSLFALGYHQQTDGENCPPFLKRLRQVAFGRCYSADRNVSIFLGRPSRIQRQCCKTHLFLKEDIGGTSEDWHSPERCNFITDARWAAVCASLKEDTARLSSEADYNERTRRASIIQAEADFQWMRLPQCYHSETELELANCKPIERDFIITARLGYLHVQFLLQRTLLQHPSQHDERLFKISTQILSLVIDAILCRDRLVNSGSSLVWKVAYFGLAAAGTICVCLINRFFATMPSSVEISATVQNLSTLVAEIERGTLVSSQHPNYALLTSATKTIDSLLKRLIASSATGVSIHNYPQSSSSIVVDQIEDLDPGIWNTQENLQDFEIDFWLNLSEHPFLRN